MKKNNKKSYFHNVNPYLYEIIYLLGGDRKRLPIMIAMFIIISILDLLGLGLVIPFVSYLSSPEDMNYVTKEISYITGYTLKDGSIVNLLSILMLTIFFIKSMAILYINRIIINFSNDQMVRIRSTLMKSYQSLKYIDYMNRNSSEYIYSIQTLSSQYATSVVLPLLRIISESIVIVVIIGFLAWVNLTALIAMLTIFISFATGYDLFFRDKLKLYGKNVNSANTKMVKAVSEGMNGFKEIRVLGKSIYFYNSVLSESIRVAENNKKAQLITIAPRYLIEFMLIAFSIAMVMWTIKSEGSLNILVPVFAVFGVASIRLLPITNNIINGRALLRIGRDCVTKLYSDIRQLKFTELIIEKTLDDSYIEPFRSLKLENVIFSFPKNRDNILNGISMQINSGESIGIIGPSGSGKSTLLDVLLGNLSTNKGRILYNGNSIIERIYEWRHHIAYLPQQVFLTDDTLRRNIAIGEEEDEIDNDKVNKALHKARLSDFVNSIDSGFDVRLGEGGMRLSGGQRQRIALARAFYYDRDVLILDESTSALDNETEQEIVDEIKLLKGKITTIIVAHRLTTVRYCDRVYELKNGIISKVNLF